MEDHIPRIFGLLLEAEVLEDMEFEDEEGNLGLEDIFIVARYHNSIVGHLGVERTLKALSLRGHGLLGMRDDG